MSDVIGLSLDSACARLISEGYSVVTEQVRSRKGTTGQDERVVRQSLFGADAIRLTTALFLTTTETQIR
ncbi:MAG: hypothetical protein RRZ24_00135 [Clostridia bacterium]